MACKNKDETDSLKARINILEQQVEELQLTYRMIKEKQRDILGAVIEYIKENENAE
tara:strand:- start:506 stop:673 length:168 start_codon:yes stop_codon:yes gene_type:complete